MAKSYTQLKEENDSIIRDAVGAGSITKTEHAGINDDIIDKIQEVDEKIDEIPAIPPGGETGQALVKTDVGVAWSNVDGVGIPGPVGGQGFTGPTGATGATGSTGSTGSAGQSSYQIAVVNGFVGSQAAWLLSLKGAPGTPNLYAVTPATLLDEPTTDLIIRPIVEGEYNLPLSGGTFQTISVYATEIDPSGDNDRVELWYDAFANEWSKQVFSKKNATGDDIIAAVGYQNENHLENTIITVDRYVDQDTGNLPEISGFKIYGHIRVVPGFMAEINPACYQQFAFYDSNGDYIINDLSARNERKFIIPAGAATIIMTVQNGQEATNYLYMYPDPYARMNGFDLNKILTDSINSDRLAGVTWTNGKYIDQTNGAELNGLAGYSASGFIDIFGNDVWRIKPGVYNQFAFYNGAQQFIANSQSANQVRVLTKPAGARYMRMTKENEDPTYLFPNDPEKLNRLKSRVVRAGAQEADSKTVQEALNYAEVQPEPYTVEVLPGVYNENLKLRNGKTKVVGVNPRDCIIETLTGDYDYPPLETSGSVYFEGLTFRARDDNWSNPSNTAYGAHIDFFGFGKIEFFNCVLESMISGGMGIGLWANTTLVVRNCKLSKNDIARPNENNVGGLYAHNHPADGHVNQRMEFWYCDVYSDTGAAIRLDDANQLYGSGTNVDTVFLFVGCTFYSNEFGTGPGVLDRRETVRGAGCLVGNIKLDPRSHGNNLAELNYSL